MTEIIAEAESEDEKTDLKAFYHDFGEDLKVANATDICSAGKVCQAYAFTEAYEDDSDESEEEK